MDGRKQLKPDLDHETNPRAIDLHAAEMPWMAGLLPCLYVPIALSEKWAVEYHSSPRMVEINRASKAVVQYADLSDIVKMINMEGGGSLMEIVNEAQKLVDLPDEK